MTMKKVMMFLGYVFMAVLLIVAAGAATVAIIGTTLDKESKEFVDAAVPAIAAEWDIKELQKRASPEFNESVDYDDLAFFFNALQDLGELTEYNGSTGESHIHLSFRSGYELTALYTASADYNTASAEIQISLIKHRGQWQILGFRVSPQEFRERKDII
jgi:hypothetical protein